MQINNNEDEDPEELISNAINQQVRNNQQVLQQIKSTSKNTKLSDQELMDMYNTMTGDGFILF